MYEAIMYIAYNFNCVRLIMVTITMNVFINIFKMEQFTAVKFVMGYEKNISFLVILKSPKSLNKKLKTGELGSCKGANQKIN